MICVEWTSELKYIKEKIMKKCTRAGKHTTTTQLAKKLTNFLATRSGVARIAPGEISQKRAKSQRIKVLKKGDRSFTLIVVGGGIQEIFVICNRDTTKSMENTIEEIEKWTAKEKILYDYKDLTCE